MTYQPLKKARSVLRYKPVYILLDKKKKDKEYKVREIAWDTYKDALNMKHTHMTGYKPSERMIKIQKIKV